MGTEIYKTLLEDLNKGEEVALITKYNLETKKVEKNIYNLEELEGKNLEYVNKPMLPFKNFCKYTFFVVYFNICY